MTDRDKLIALYKEWWEAPFDEEECEDCTEDISRCNECLYGKFADYLISHGVCIRENGEWVAQTPEDDKYCWSPFKCNKCNMPGGKNRTNFCPNCGADIRRKNELFER